MTKSIAWIALTIAAACGGGSAASRTAPATPTDPIPMNETPQPAAATTPAGPAELTKPAEPAGPDPAGIVNPLGKSGGGKADVLAAEQAAYEKAKPVFDKWCAKCHTKSGKMAAAKKLDHFDMTVYPFGGHHAMELGKQLRKSLGIDASNPTMPFDKKGAVKGDELALIAAWADAFDAAHAAGAHEGHSAHGHQH